MSREPVTLVELVIPTCSLSHGTSPCTATGEPCFNTFFTCQDKDNFDQTETSLFFTMGDVGSRSITGLTYPRELLLSVSSGPTQVNIARSDSDRSGLGLRARYSIRLMDRPDPDRIVDPYTSQRSYNPLDRSTFWVKFLVRQKYVTNLVVKIHEGYAGDDLADMVTRTGIVTDISPASDGGVTITAKDVLTNIEERKAQAPVANQGLLYSGITATDLTFEVAGASVDDYSASGTLRVGDELMTYSAVAVSDNGIRFTITARGTDNTTAVEHEFDEGVQECLRFDDEPIEDALRTLLRDYGNVPDGYLDYANWADEIGDYLPSVRINAIITEPTAVTKLVADMMEQTGAFIWWDERQAKVLLRVVRGYLVEPDTLTEERHLIGDLQKVNRPDDRVSRIVIHYGVKDYTQSLSEFQNYSSTQITANPGSEIDLTNGTPSIRTIYAYYLQSGANVRALANRIIQRYVDTPERITFTVDAKDGAYGIGDVVQIVEDRTVDIYGAAQPRKWVIISYEPVHSQQVVKYVADNADAYDQIYLIQASGAADYVDGQTIGTDAFIGDADGLLPDGAPAAVIN